ncbi:LiaF transmembrane domain-containing protein [Companilactobacillus halodurans]|uniref:LiaF transmembrane domain-containing protein n=1 Tax=Companilactobacillus halodurans TaxID=2584183 RepID=A0A5P0ZPW1_9LACO|nr:hypothetical protein [Companilactobacillus halodurans]MQS76238.1 hypothetical protein [Companilactobacillus halodurans]MQS97379.1 hypothetical protein [Companilactobacillus halodurans]
MRNRSRIFWGLFLLVSAAILIVSQLHLLTYTFTFWTIVATIILVAFLIKSLTYFSVSGTVFSLAFLAILYAKPLGIASLSAWTILGAALLISIGLSLIFRPFLARHRPWMKKIYKYKYQWNGKGDFNSDVKTVDDPDVEVDVKMGNSTRYVESNDFKSADINVEMGNAKIYFEHVNVQDTAVINVNVSLGAAELYVPRDWNIINGLDNNLSNISENGVRKVDVDSPNVTVQGLVSLANLKITYI